MTTDTALITIHLYGDQPLVVTGWTLFGFVGNVLFTARVFIQWIASERAKRSVSNASFWWASLGAAIILIIYGFHQVSEVDPGAMTFLLLFTVSIVPYMRNLMLIYDPRRRYHLLSFLISAAILLFCLFYFPGRIKEPLRFNFWLVLGFAGMLIFGTRFIWQWLYSEIKGESIFPLWFWIMSVIGASLNLIYAMYLRDLVFIIGFLFPIFPMARNIVLIQRQRASQPDAG